MHNTHQKGFTPLIPILIIATIAVASLIAWRLYNSSQANQQNNQSDQSNNQTPAPQQQPTDPNEGYVVIKEWGVRFKPVEGLVGVEYFKPSDLTADEVTFTTDKLAGVSAYCRQDTGNIILGLLSRNTTQRERYGGVVAKVGDYYYQFAGPQASCTENDEDGLLESQTITALSKSLDSLEASK